MSSYEADAESIRAAIKSTSTCTPVTVTSLSDLLLPKSSSLSENRTIPTSNTRKTATSTTNSRSKPQKAPAKSRSKKVQFPDQENQQQQHEDVHEISQKARSILATEVINATLKALTEAIKAPAPPPVRQQPSSKDLIKTTSRRNLRRSNSLPQSPQQPRTLNRVSSSPGPICRLGRSASSASLTSPGPRSLAECARIAFACLRSLQTAQIPGVNLPPLQLENGMSVLVGKLITLGLDDLALKEVRILRRRLELKDPTKKPLPTKVNGSQPPQELHQLIDFGTATFTGPKLALVITTQLQILRLMASTKYTTIDVSILSPQYPSSPTSFLMSSVTDEKSREKAARQLQNLSDILLSLCPSVTTSEDAIAVQPKLSVDPFIAYQLQSLALQTRLLSWTLLPRQADFCKDLFEPFLRCLSTYARRIQRGRASRSTAAVFESLHELWKDKLVGEQPPELSQVFFDIYRLLSSLLQERGCLEDALGLALQLEKHAGNSSVARQTFVIARQVSVSLKSAKRTPKEEELLMHLLDLLESPYTGSSSEIDDLMTEVSGARRTAIALLARATPTCSAEHQLTEGMRQMCETLVFLCPRLGLRYLGKAPDSNAATKDVVRYEQRRMFIRKFGLHSLDSTLFLVRTLLNEGRLSWDLMDSKLQDCLTLIDQIGPESEEPSSPGAVPTPSSYVRISNLYYTYFLNERRSSSGMKDAQQLRILKRSIDCIRSRSSSEKKAALSTMKLERMAELYKSASRYDELLEVFKTMRDDSINDGVLSDVATTLASQPLRAAWELDEAASLLARAAHTLLKIKVRYFDSATEDDALFDPSWSRVETAAMAEHLLLYLCAQTKKSEGVLELQSSMFKSLLDIYDREQYPVRRLRVVIELMGVDLSELGEELHDFPARVQEEVCMEEHNQIDIEETEDRELEPYWEYFKCLAATTFELQKDEPDIHILESNVLVWRKIQSSCSTLEALESRFEDIEGFVGHLQTIASFLQVKGHDTLRITVLDLISNLNAQLRSPSGPDGVVSNLIAMGSQWLYLGYSGRAGLALDKAQTCSDQRGVSLTTVLQFHLAYAEYLLEIGNLDKSEEFLQRARTLYCTDQASRTGRSVPQTVQEKVMRTQLISYAYLINSKLAMSNGAAHLALAHAKDCVRLLRQAWARIQEQNKRVSTSSTTSQPSDVGDLADELAKFAISTAPPPNAARMSSSKNSCFWTLVKPLFSGLIHLSDVYSYLGMFQETIYYAEQSQILVKQTNSAVYQALAAALLGNAWLRAGVLDKGSEFLNQSKELSSLLAKSRETATLAYYVGNMHDRLGDHDAAIESYDVAEQTLEELIVSEREELEQKRAPLGITEAVAKLQISDTNAGRKRKAVTRPKAPPKKKAVARAKTPVLEPVLTILEECSQLESLKATVLRQKARILILMKQCGAALVLLERAALSEKTGSEVVDHRLAMAKQLLFQSLEQMIGDPVYSVLQDSTISFPSVMGMLKCDSVTTKSPPVKKVPAAKGGRGVARAKIAASDACFEQLRQAQELLMEAHSIAVVISPVGIIHKISALFNSVSILLSASGYSKGKLVTSPGFSSCTIETARTLGLRRERKAIQADISTPNVAVDYMSWPPTATTESRRTSLSVPQDLSRFQRDYVEIIPKSWMAISISLSDSRNELSITKMQAGQTPFVLRLPLGRHNSMDADEEVFGFEQGQAELLDIIQRANETAHSSKNTTGREAKAAWWEEREELDLRLKELLENIQKVWLGGFTGIFSQHTRRSDLLARFQKSFQNILDKYLPSRQKSKKRTAVPRITLDSRILDLFIGLGDASIEDIDLSEPLTDLLYFVVDILQFHGEYNAYAEIDFDQIVIETHDALRCYHEAIHASNQANEGRHTILILDKALHAFPWESLPCMDGQAVSRLPSLGCLRERIMLQHSEERTDTPEGYYIHPGSGSYVLNPSGDLKNTQSTFEKSLQSLKWDGIIKREPTEQEIIQSLQVKDLFLYFGHGSGAQYVRAREIRKLSKCSVAFLMGCSSGALGEVGEFEPHGPAINYMHAGSPALVATLWDVTDKDIDRFAKTTFEHWGLFESESKNEKKGKGKKKAAVTEHLSVVEAVAKGKEACKLRYLNAAAVCVYGIPVYLKAGF